MFYVAEGGWFQHSKENTFELQALMGVLAWNDKSVGGASKNFLWLAWCLIFKSSAPGLSARYIYL